MSRPARLRDERANLIDSLSKIVNVSYNEIEVQNTYGDNLGGTNFSLYINGEKVVEGKDYRKLILLVVKDEKQSDRQR